MNTNLLKQLKTLRRDIGTIRASNYDITSVCNLTCEGCLYFEGEDYLGHQENKSLDAWTLFFKSEHERGVNFAYIAGAEPSFVIDRLRAANRYIANGVIFTNGSKAIPKDIGFRIHVSIWGVEDEKKLRGNDVLLNALKNYAGDERVVFNFTLNRLNINQVMTAISLCHEHQVKITFSYFSATRQYLAKLKGDSTLKQGKYFRISSERDHLILSADDYALAEQEILEGKARYPETVLFSSYFHHFVANHHYALDDQGYAMGCGSRLSPEFRHYAVDMTLSTGICCSPNISCTHCKAYTQMYATFLLHPAHKQAHQLEEWMQVWALWAQLFLPARAIQSGHESMHQGA